MILEKLKLGVKFQTLFQTWFRAPNLGETFQVSGFHVKSATKQVINPQKLAKLSNQIVAWSISFHWTKQTRERHLRLKLRQSNLSVFSITSNEKLLPKTKLRDLISPKELCIRLKDWNAAFIKFSWIFVTCLPKTASKVILSNKISLMLG